MNSKKPDYKSQLRYYYHRRNVIKEWHTWPLTFTVDASMASKCSGATLSQYAKAA